MTDVVSEGDRTSHRRIASQVNGGDLRGLKKHPEPEEKGKG